MKNLCCILMWINWRNCLNSKSNGGHWIFFGKMKIKIETRIDLDWRHCDSIHQQLTSCFFGGNYSRIFEIIKSMKISVQNIRLISMQFFFQSKPLWNWPLVDSRGDKHSWAINGFVWNAHSPWCRLKQARKEDTQSFLTTQRQHQKHNAAAANKLSFLARKANIS